MLSKTLKEGLEGVGFSLVDTSAYQDVSNVLAEVLRSKDSRLLHGFPVMLANALEKDALDVSEFVARLTGKDKKLAASLVAFSAVVFSDAGYKNNKLTQLQKALPGGSAAGFDREKGEQLFNLYFRPGSYETADVLETKRDMSLEFALSELFSPKQKELVLRKLKGGKFSKTESEYYSRVAKKRLKALANVDLHKLAVSLVEK